MSPQASFGDLTVERQQKYQPEVLHAPGSVRRLTAAGSGPQVENGNPGNCSQTKGRKPCS